MIEANQRTAKRMAQFTTYEVVLATGGIGYCNITECCTKVCPENITITDNAIIPLKERVVDDFYDPFKKLLRLFSGKRA